MAAESYTQRLADPLFEEYVASFPAVLVTGPRAAGKTTMCRRSAASLLRLDEPATASAVAAGPDAALRNSPTPVLVDEWQEVPEILGAVKRWVDEDPTPGRVILTGSVAAPLSTKTWPGTGRIITIELLGLTQRELRGAARQTDWIDAVALGDLGAIRIPDPAPDLADYIAAMLMSGFPEPALRLPANLRRPWLDAYLEHVIQREVPSLAQRRDPVRMQRWLEATALLTAAIPHLNALTQAAGVDRRTGQAYDDVLARLYLLDLLPAWHSNRLSRLTSQPKRHLVDTGLAAAAIGLDTAALLRDGGLLGSLLETFVVSQLRPETNLRRSRTRLFHLRTDGGRSEVDILIDLGGGRVIGIEVKAAGAVQQRDARHLKTLRTALGDDFVRGVVLHTGPFAYEVDDRIWALPISSFWG
jgi:predicted AAA+ superfamily ATPase